MENISKVDPTQLLQESEKAGDIYEDGIMIAR
jgi:hypothetical protein